jgi:hypothetical protein
MPDLNPIHAVEDVGHAVGHAASSVYHSIACRAYFVPEMYVDDDEPRTIAPSLTENRQDLA